MTQHVSNGSNLPAVFTYGANEKVNILQINNQPWFIAKDICNILSIKDTHRAVSGLDEDERQILTGVDSKGKNNKMTFVNESGLYNLIFRSNKPEAKVFRKWVTNEVLPALRKQGNYHIADAGKMVTISERRKQKASEMNNLIYEALVISGSARKLADRLKISAPVLSRISAGDANIFSEDMLAKIEKGCKIIIEGTEYTVDSATNFNYRFTDSEILSMITDLSKYKSQRALRQSIISKLLQGGVK